MRTFGLAVLGVCAAAIVSTAARPATAAPLGREALLGPAPAARTVDFFVHLPLRAPEQLDALIRNQSTPGSPLYHHFLSPAQFRSAFGPAPQTVERAAAALRARGFTVVKTGTQVLRVRGSAAGVERAFATRLALVRTPQGRLATRASAAVVVPAELTALGATVHGLTSGPRIRPFAHVVRPNTTPGFLGLYWFTDLKQAYSYPSYTVYNGTGKTIATVGTNDFSDADTAAYFAHEGLGGPNALAPAPLPTHVALPDSLPFDPVNFPTGSFEANVDVQQANGSAPGATVEGIAVPVIDPISGFLYAYSLIDDDNTIDIVSTSLGGCELQALASYSADGIDQLALFRAFHDLFRQGNAQGITFVFASGDAAGLACQPPAYYLGGPGLTVPAIAGIYFWANDPNVTAVGGTNLATTGIAGGRRALYASEAAFANAQEPSDPFGLGNTVTGQYFGSTGGQSMLWLKPDYQKIIETHLPGRTVPDVSMHMGGCPEGALLPCTSPFSAAAAYFGGQLVGAIGTSLSAPEFAGLLAVAEQAQGGVRFGNVNPLIYQLAHDNATYLGPFFHQHIPGFNGLVHHVSPSYDTITGVGTPVANRFMLQPFVPLAGDPLTASNP